MAKFQIKYGLAGGFGGAGEWKDCNATTMEQAEEEAMELACEVYESYEGMHGLRTVEEIMEEEELNEEDALQEYEEERDSWLDYEAREVE